MVGRISAFAATEFAGSTIVNGNAEYCVKGFGDAGYSPSSPKLIEIGRGNGRIGSQCMVDGKRNQWLIGQFAKRDAVMEPWSERDLTKRWPPREAEQEQIRLANGTRQLLGLIFVMESIFNETLEQALYAVWPNPFLNSTPAMENVDHLFLVDGSEVLQEIPIWPIIQPARRPDFIIANDAGGTELSNGWMNGTSLIDTAAYTNETLLQSNYLTLFSTIL